MCYVYLADINPVIENNTINITGTRLSKGNSKPKDVDASIKNNTLHASDPTVTNAGGRSVIVIDVAVFESARTTGSEV